tara:strand:+ start:19634 stop:20080 length:447 start_codon:yes stop_codon:yes gene_type:complete
MEYDDTAQLLYVAYAKSLAALELANLRKERTVDPAHNDMRTYILSTSNRRHFCLLNIGAFFDETFITPSKVVVELGISRNAVDTMISETEGNGWLTVSRDPNSYRRHMAAPLMVDCWNAYAKWVARKSNDLGFGDIEGALRLLRKADK